MGPALKLLLLLLLPFLRINDVAGNLGTGAGLCTTGGGNSSVRQGTPPFDKGERMPVDEPSVTEGVELNAGGTNRPSLRSTR